MNTRFTDLQSRAKIGLMLVPTELDNLKDIEGLMYFFGEDLSSPYSLKAEIQQWREKWKNDNEKPKSLKDAIK